MEDFGKLNWTVTFDKPPRKGEPEVLSRECMSRIHFLDSVANRLQGEENILKGGKTCLHEAQAQDVFLDMYRSQTPLVEPRSAKLKFGILPLEKQDLETKMRNTTSRGAHAMSNEPLSGEDNISEDALPRVPSTETRFPAVHNSPPTPTQTTAKRHNNDTQESVADQAPLAMTPTKRKSRGCPSSNSPFLWLLEI